MITREVFSDIFQIQVPLPHNPLGHLNSYLIRSAKENLLIDTGMNFPESFHALCTGLSDAGVKPEELTEILLTHFHVDHIGLVPRFKEASKNIKLSIHRVEAELSKLMLREFGNYRENMKTFLEANGTPSAITVNLERFHPAFFTSEAFRELAVAAVPADDGQEISIGGYNLQVVWTPGHSPGHICLYEPSLRVLFSGDHLLPTITSHIAQFMENMSPLTDYLNSLEKTEKLDVKVVLPAHEETFTDHQGRTKQLKAHHEQRLMEIMDGLKNGNSTAYALTSKIHWNVHYKSWDAFPLFQKYLALGETVAHLNLLEQRGLVRRTRVGQITSYGIDRGGNQTKGRPPDLS